MHIEGIMDKKLEKVIQVLWGLKYRNISAYDIEESGVSRFLVVATAVTTTDNKKYSTAFAEEMKYAGKIEGWHKGEWMIIDMEDIVIHLFASGHREKYNMDKLYKGKEINLPKLSKKKKA